MCICMCACGRGEYLCVCMCVYGPVQPVERSCWHGNTAKDKRDGFRSLSRYRSSQVCARLKTHTDRTGKTGTFLKYPTDMNEGKSPQFSRSLVPVCEFMGKSLMMCSVLG